MAKGVFYRNHGVDASESLNHLLFIRSGSSRQRRAQRGDGKEDLGNFERSCTSPLEPHPAVFDTRPVGGDVLILQSECREHLDGDVFDDAGRACSA